MHSRLGIAIVALGILVGGCGSTPTDRAVTGAGIGAGAGAIAGYFFGAPWIGALVGAAGGAAAGAATTPSQVDLGKPVWE
jgi:osmotically inducible lipoprotein OsmB